MTNPPTPGTKSYWIDKALEILSRMATSAEKAWAWSILRGYKWLDVIRTRNTGKVDYDPNAK